jgi:hypothetical protein
MGTYAMALFALGFGDVLGDLVDPRRDDQGPAARCATVAEACPGEEGAYGFMRRKNAYFIRLSRILY